MDNTLIQTADAAYKSGDYPKALSYYLGAYKEMQPVYVTENERSMKVFERIEDCYCMSGRVEDAVQMGVETMTAAKQNAGLSRTQIARISLVYSGVLARKRQPEEAGKIISEGLSFQIPSPAIPDEKKTEYQFYSNSKKILNQMSCFDILTYQKALENQIALVEKTNAEVMGILGRNAGVPAFRDGTRGVDAFVRNNSAEIAKMKQRIAKSIQDFRSIEGKNKAIDKVVEYAQQNFAERNLFPDVAVDGMPCDIFLILPENIFSIMVVSGDGGVLRKKENGEFCLDNNGVEKSLKKILDSAVLASETTAEYFGEHNREIYKDHPITAEEYKVLCQPLVVVTDCTMGNPGDFTGLESVVTLDNFRTRGYRSNAPLTFTEAAIARHGKELIGVLKKPAKKVFSDVFKATEAIQNYNGNIHGINKMLRRYLKKLENIYAGSLNAGGVPAMQDTTASPGVPMPGAIPQGAYPPAMPQPGMGAAEINIGGTTPSYGAPASVPYSSPLNGLNAYNPNPPQQGTPVSSPIPPASVTLRDNIEENMEEDEQLSKKERKKKQKRDAKAAKEKAKADQKADKARQKAQKKAQKKGHTGLIIFLMILFILILSVALVFVLDYYGMIDLSLLGIPSITEIFGGNTGGDNPLSITYQH